jgi:hypothetical protein
MKANELRIGNLVYCWNPAYNVPPNTYDTIITINWKHIRNCVEQPNHGTYKPIPLTEEILLKAGFEKSGEGIFNHDYFNGVYFEIDSEFIGNDNENICGDFDECVHIRMPKELHKLQNIVFDLTGKELEIKL